MSNNLGSSGAPRGPPRRIAAGGDPYGTHRALDPRGALPQPAWRVDNDFTRLFAGEVLLAVETLTHDPDDAVSPLELGGAADTFGLAVHPQGAGERGPPFEFLDAKIKMTAAGARQSPSKK